MDRRVSPGQIPFLWRRPGDDAWIHFDDNKYAAENVHEALEYRIDVNALEATIKRRQGRAEGPYRVEIALPSPFLKGRELGRKHRNEQLRTYRLLIALFESYPTSSQTCERDRNLFLRGFGAAYAEANGDAKRANEVQELLKKSLLLEDCVYRRLLAQGGMHEKGELSNAQIADIIGRYIKSPEQELACKAGYIEGYVQAHSSPEKERLYVDALWMYIAVRPSMRL